jgi:hypothetical protein
MIILKLKEKYNFFYFLLIKMDYIDKKLLQSLLLGVGVAFIIVYLQQQEMFCYGDGKKWSKCGISPKMAIRKNGVLF